MEGGNFSNIARVRIANEFKQLKANPPGNWNIYQDNNNIGKWKIYVVADVVFVDIQTNCPFHTIPIEINVTFPENYPAGAPKLTLEKPNLFMHPNMNNGNICEKDVTSSSGMVTVA